MVTFVIQKNLRLVFKTSECPGVNDTFPVPLELQSIGMGLFRINTAAAPGGKRGPGRQGLRFPLFQ
jgi:hypothetical protein